MRKSGLRNLNDGFEKDKQVPRTLTDLPAAFASSHNEAGHGPIENARTRGTSQATLKLICIY